MAQVVVFESGNDPAQDVSNPCDSETWIFPSNAYDDNIVMIFYNSSLEDWCSVQQWTLSMENYANILALLVVYEDGEDYVTELSGDDSLDDPTVPTRVISQYAAGQILDMSDPVVTLGCYESTGFPPQICMSDTSDDGLHIHLDGMLADHTSNMEIVDLSVLCLQIVILLFCHFMNYTPKGLIRRLQVTHTTNTRFGVNRD